MNKLCAALCVLLFVGVMPQAEIWVEKEAPPDKETTDVYKAGTISPRQAELAKAFLELASAYAKDDKTREAKDAIRRAAMRRLRRCMINNRHCPPNMRWNKRVRVVLMAKRRL